MAPFGVARTGMDWEGARGLECDNVLCSQGLGYTGEHVLLECDDVLCVHGVWVIQVSMFFWSVMMCSVFTGFGLCR